MEKISNEELEKLLEAGITIKDKEIEAEEINLEYTEYGYFENCIFNSQNIKITNIQNNELILCFIECVFTGTLVISNCTFNELIFRDTKTLKSIQISHFKVNSLEFSNDSENKAPELSTQFTIRLTKIKTFIFHRMKHLDGTFNFMGNTIEDYTSFQYSTITNTLFTTNHFLISARFKKITFNSNQKPKPVGSSCEFPGFYRNTFTEISFSNSNFTNSFKFKNCNFLNKVLFKDCENLENSVVKFEDCNFEKYSKFDNTKFNKFEILQSTFLDKVSFDNLETNSFIINQVTFSKSAYFDDLNKNNNKAIESWDRKTVRTIKQELQKTENRID